MPQYIDEYDQIWIRIDAYNEDKLLIYIYNETLGIGIWDKGRGLKPLNKAVSGDYSSHTAPDIVPLRKTFTTSDGIH